MGDSYRIEEVDVSIFLFPQWFVEYSADSGQRTYDYRSTFEKGYTGTIEPFGSVNDQIVPIDELRIASDFGDISSETVNKIIEALKGEMPEPCGVIAKPAT